MIFFCEIVSNLISSGEFDKLADEKRIGLDLLYIKNGNAYLTKQFGGSLEECDERATKELTNCRNSDSIHIRTLSLK